MFLDQHNDVLDLVDQLRLQGVSHYIDLPQIIVCGDQSSGKSSVLEAISGIQFPRKDNLCTRFATEVVLRRAVTASTSVTIAPANDRLEHDRDRISQFQRSDIQLENVESLVEEARQVMGIDGTTRAFSNDVLRVELCGPDQPHLTLVDLPGLFSAGNKAQSDSDADAVKSLVWSYMRNPRSIILAVVSAKNDFANQIVTKYTRDLDPEGDRTLGVITKPDTLHAGSESERSFLALAKNEDVHFRLGWHVLRNRDFDTRALSAEQRDQVEHEFFATGVWTELSKSQVGIHALRPRLSHLLRQQILVELPNLIVDVEKGLDECNRSLSHMGTVRATTNDQRLYLLRISQDFTFLVRSAVDGSYSDDFFGSATTADGCRKRLRAVVQNKSLKFAKSMRERGHARHIIDAVTKKQAKADPRLISKDKYVDHVLALMTRSRGRELPGTYNPHIISDLFSEQSQPWQALVHFFVVEIWDATQTTLGLILNHVADLNTAANLQSKFLQPALDVIKDRLDKAVGIALHQTVHGHPITYNHYLTENIQKLRAEQRKAILAQKVDQFFGTNIALGKTYCTGRDFDVKSLLQILTEDTMANMDRYACSEAADVMKAYYKVALKTCIDDTAHTIERELLRQLPSLLSAQTMMALDDTTVNSIATEPTDVQQDRARLVRKQKALQTAFSALRILSRSASSGIDEDNGLMLMSSDDESGSEGFEGREHNEIDKHPDVAARQYPDIETTSVADFYPEQAVEPLAMEIINAKYSFEGDWAVPVRSTKPDTQGVLGKPSKKTKKSKTNVE